MSTNTSIYAVCSNCNEPNKHESRFYLKYRMALTYDAYSETLQEQKKKEDQIKTLEKKYENDMKQIKENIENKLQLITSKIDISKV